MFEPSNQVDEVDQLLLNAQLRDALEPFYDESVGRIDMDSMPTPTENEFLASMLAWEQAPVLPISKWFEPELVIPSPESLNDQELSKTLNRTIEQLYSKKIVLEFADHLNDRELYCMIYRDILRSYEKKVDLPKNFLHWHCIDDKTDEETWLEYYATDKERCDWAEETGRALPPQKQLPFCRRMPRKP